MRTWILLVLAVTLLTGCGRGPATIVVATTTSTADTGLLDELNAAFVGQHPGYVVKTIAVGTGEALRLGEQKEADVVLVHARTAEDEFVNSGFGHSRRDVMYNDFVIVGPPDDPAGIRGRDPVAALQRIAAMPWSFVSRGDNSGTHMREQALWREAGTEPAGQWYISSGQGMGPTLQIGSEKRAYVATDRGTFLAMDALDLEVLVQGDASLLNRYGVIEVVGARNPDGARAWADFLVSEQGQDIIARFGTERFGQPLFFPDANK